MSTSIITIFVRHGNDAKGNPCKYSGDEFSRRCNCRKHFRWTQNGTQYRRKAGTRSWEEAEEIKRQLQDQLAGRIPEQRPEDNVRTVTEAIDLFITDKKVRGVSDGVVARYRSELGRFQVYCEGENAFTVTRITRELLTGYASTWEEHYPSSNTRASVRERLRSFLRYCFECRWLDRIPAVPKVEANEPPTLPLTDAEYAKILRTIDSVRPARFDVKGVTRLLSTETKQRLRALIQLMRWSGLAIQDAVKIRKADIIQEKRGGIYRVVTARQKTGTHVSVPIPPDVAKEVLEVPSANPGYIFWTGKSKGRSQVIMWGSRYVRPLFEAAGVRSGHMVSHRLRDTFAVDLLQKGVPMEEVSKLLGHESIKTTEKHYARWVKGRQDRLDALVTGTWDVPTSRRKK
ncbi:tyrosine-type recombinase/integrase [Telmatobacter sp. DSM 110680]|uniref:Tyrosine-type recombinase/integrase n=1 Tax=Telmatobacter sp. DSM 110680 TaxID=3036704 RepID=A0AAU7DFT8_9BACT